MQQPLFIHSDPGFSSRIQREAGPHALIASHFTKAVEWISHPGLTIPAIYLSPNDPNFSALRFLEIATLHRPATPIFLIDDDGEIARESQLPFLENISIKGLFNKSDSYQTFISVLSDKPNFSEGSSSSAPLAEIKRGVLQRGVHAGYLALPVNDLRFSKTYPLDVFIENHQKQLRLFATAGSPVEAEYLTHVAQITPWIFVTEASVQEMQEGIHHAQKSYMELKSFPTSWKAAETLYKAKLLLEDMKKVGLSDRLVEQTHFLLSDVFLIVSQLNGSDRIQHFIRQAKDCDESVACATLSILMCKALKFEKNAIVEILGLASFFQNISLIQSPFGNLSEMNRSSLSPEAEKYYFNHAVHSADILAETTSLPEVTLQVIRQHHERKDRTGFPNRIGGMQIHPMAEILSLINDYLEHSLNFEDVEHEIYSHYSDRIVAAFKPLRDVLRVAQRNIA